jgi:prepilin-type N-terminal cleavage/methylation domain-containing protein
MLKTKSGFTIVELLIVIVVIGILAAITIVAYNGIQDRANDTSVKSDYGKHHEAT